MPKYFKLIKSTDLSKTYSDKDELILPTSDFSILSQDNKFLQFSLEVDNEEVVEHKVKVKPGIFAIGVENREMTLIPTGFTKQSILDEYYYTKLIESNIDTFFAKLPIYDELGIFPKRATLLYGPPGSGKSSVLAKICEKYSTTKDTTVVVWPSDKFEARDVKDFLNSFDYQEHAIKRLILVIEDLGGAEQSSGIRYSEASLLALLDNVEATFKIPTVILATTNFPEMFLENLTNRPQRFDDVIEVKRPGKENRLKLLAFFKGSELNEAEVALFSQSKFDIFSPAHLKEVIVRSKLYDLSIIESAELVFEQANRAIKQFSNKSRMGFD